MKKALSFQLSAVSLLLFLFSAALVAQPTRTGPPVGANAVYPQEGTLFGPNGTAVINALGKIDAASGTASNCMHVDGSNGSCASSSSPTGAASGDLCGNYPGPTLCAAGDTAGTYGDGTHVAQVTVDAKGRVTTAASVAITSLSAPGGALASVSGSAASIAAGTAMLGNTVYTIPGCTVTPSAGTGTIFFYVTNSGVATAGHNVTATLTTGTCTVTSGTSAYPQGSKPIGRVTVTSGAVVAAFDDRSINSWDALQAGTGPISVTQAGGLWTVNNTTASADVVATFSGCSGTMYLGADGACHTASGGGSGVRTLSFPVGTAPSCCSTTIGGIFTNGSNGKMNFAVPMAPYAATFPCTASSVTAYITYATGVNSAAGTWSFLISTGWAADNATPSMNANQTFSASAEPTGTGYVGALAPAHETLTATFGSTAMTGCSVAAGENLYVQLADGSGTSTANHAILSLVLTW